MGSRFPQFSGDKSHAAFSLCQTEPALHFHSLALIPIVLRLVSGFALLWAAQCRTREPDSVRLTIAEILPVSVDLVCQNTAGVMPLPLAESLCHLL